MSAQELEIASAVILRSDEEVLAAAKEAANYIREGAIDRDRHRRLPWEEIKLLSRSGLMSLTVPKSHGGTGIKATTIAEVFRLISAADPSVGQIPQNHYLIAAALYTGTPAQQEFFWGRLLKGERFGNANSESTMKRPRDYETLVERVPGGYRLTGKKFYTTGAIFAHWVTISAFDEHKRRIVFLAERHSSGLTVVDDWSGMGMRTTASGTTILDGVFIPDERVIPFYKVRETPKPVGPISSLIHIAVDLGVAEEALADAKNYIRTKNRPWIENPFDEHAKEPFIVQRFGELQVKFNTSLALYQHAAEKIDAYTEAPSAERALATSLAVADARVYSTQTALEITSELFALTGARATLAEYDLDRHWRNTRTHTLHDPLRWKLYHIGNHRLNDVPLPTNSYI
jgi:SfnB family sulfur acquisition oxidoreductase